MVLPHLPGAVSHGVPHTTLHIPKCMPSFLAPQFCQLSALVSYTMPPRHCESQGRPERTHHYPSADRYLGQRHCQTTSTRSEHRLSSEGCARVFALASGTIPIAAPQPPMPHLPWSRASRSAASSISKQQSAQHLYTDASGSWGVGALAYPHWFQIQWGESPRLHPSLSRIYCPQWWRQPCGGTSGGGHTYRAMQTKRPQWPRSTPFTPGIAPQPTCSVAWPSSKHTSGCEQCTVQGV